MKRTVTVPRKPIVDELAIARDGFVFAKQHRDNFFAGVNCCPYGPAWPGGNNVKAEAWYRGWWFFFHVVKKWSDATKDTKES